jgi:SAM-dependent methyltransferase
MAGFISRLIRRLTGRSSGRYDFSWMYPPATLVDPQPWDQFWRDRLANGMAGAVHMFCDDGPLIDAMRANGLKTVLCVGNGISQEPRALARAGFEVTALDLSPFATEVAQRAELPDDLLAYIVDGRPLDTKGHVEFVVGDLCDPGCCPGPYDVVIERKTLQLYPPDHRSEAFAAVANRLASRGIFFSHCHNGGWRRGEPRIHTNESWFTGEGWDRWRAGTPLQGRVAWLFLSTG